MRRLNGRSTPTPCRRFVLYYLSMCSLFKRRKTPTRRNFVADNGGHMLTHRYGGRG